MAWLLQLGARAANLLLSNPPSKVIEVSASSYSARNVNSRGGQGMLLLYAPIPNETESRFEVALQTEQKLWSLGRYETRDAAELWFVRFEDKVPHLVIASKDNSSAFLQRVCDTISDHPSWNIAHLAVKLQLTECLNDQAVKEAFHMADPTDGMSPLQLAIELENLKMINTLLAEGAPVDHCDRNQNSVLHYAASTNKKIVTLITAQSKTFLNSKNSQGETPLHVACIKDKRECVMALLEIGADVNIAIEGDRGGGGEPGLLGASFQQFNGKFSNEDIKYGGTPLHWACSQEVIDALVEKKCDINVLNFQKRTALHMMVMRGRFDCVVCLLGHGADKTVCDVEGNTPLRMAVSKLDVLSVKALIVFNANIHEINQQGHSLRHGIQCGQPTADEVLYVLHSVGVGRCGPDVRGCTAACSTAETYNGLPPPKPEPAETRDTLNILLEECNTLGSSTQGRLLCLDGGGIRGLILIVILMELEKAVGRPIIECFDWVAGTSTGGILSLALAWGKPLQFCLNLYFKLKNTVFVGIRPYPREPLEKILIETFGEDTTMADIDKPRLMITATLADRQPVDLHLFRNYESPADILSIPPSTAYEEPKPPAMQKLWEAARASGAAPSYFKAAGCYVDGGLISNNPTLDAMTEIHEFNVALRAMNRKHESTPLSLVVSIGTGSVPRQENEAAMGVLQKWGNMMDLLNISMLSIASVKGIGQIMNMLVDQATQADGRVVDRARAWCSSLGVPYYRLCPMLSKEVALNETQNDKLVNMMWETRAYMYEKMPQLSDLIEVLRQPLRMQGETITID